MLRQPPSPHHQRTATTPHQALKHIRLQLARSKEFPSGSVCHGYDLVAPLDEKGHIDPELWRKHQKECRVRRFWDDEEDANGLLVHKPGGAEHARWMFDYGAGSIRGRGSGLPVRSAHVRDRRICIDPRSRRRTPHLQGDLRGASRIVMPPTELIWIKYECDSSIKCAMTFTTPNTQDLLRKCDEAMRSGIDFPTLWHAVIKQHPTVAGVPIQRSDGHRTYLEIPLLRGDYLVVDTEGRTVSLR